MNCNVIVDIASYRCFQTHNTILQAAILHASINALLNCNVIHKNVFSNPQYNPTSLCIKDNAELASYLQMKVGTFRSNKDQRKGIPPSRGTS